MRSAAVRRTIDIRKVVVDSSQEDKKAAFPLCAAGAVT